VGHIDPVGATLIGVEGDDVAVGTGGIEGAAGAGGVVVRGAKEEGRALTSAVVVAQVELEGGGEGGHRRGGAVEDAATLGGGVLGEEERGVAHHAGTGGGGGVVGGAADGRGEVFLPERRERWCLGEGGVARFAQQPKHGQGQSEAQGE